LADPASKLGSQGSPDQQRQLARHQFQESKGRAGQADASSDRGQTSHLVRI
jgi:hypothetical protein